MGGTMQEALTTPATRTRCARTSTGSPTFPRRKGGTGGWSWGLVVRGAAKHLEDHPKVALRCEQRDPGAAELTSEDHVVLTLGPRNSLIEVRCGDGDAVGALDRLSLLAVVVRGNGVYPVEPPRADPVVVFVPPYRRL